MLTQTKPHNNQPHTAGALSGCLLALVGRPAAPKLSLVQAARLEELQARVGIPYDPANALHREGLKELWDLAFPNAPPPPDLKGAQWKEMGWQGVDPATDFRAAGLLGLDCLLYLGRERPALFRELLGKTRGCRSSWEYPFGAAGTNVTWALVELLQLQHGSSGDGSSGGSGKGPGSCAAGRGFIGLLSADGAAFEEVYCAAFDLLDRIWIERGATYMEFNSILKDVVTRVGRALAARPADVGALRAALGLPPAPGG